MQYRKLLCFHPEIVIVIYAIVDVQTIASPTALAARAIVYEDASGKKLQPQTLRHCFR